MDLKSVKTSVDLRDERLRDWVFETGKFGAATITGKVDMATIDKLAVGQRLTLEQPLKLDLHGSKADIDATLSVYRRTADIIDVQTVNPVILNTQELGLGEGVNKLIDVMGLLTIADQVPVSFGAEFHRKP